MGDRAKKKGRFCRKEILVKGEARSMGYDNVDTRVVRTPMALDHKKSMSLQEKTIRSFPMTHLTVDEYWD